MANIPGNMFCMHLNFRLLTISVEGIGPIGESDCVLKNKHNTYSLELTESN